MSAAWAERRNDHPDSSDNALVTCGVITAHYCVSRGPEQHGLLDYETVRDVLTGAIEEGYEVASFSGGEPILCEDLGRMLRHAKELGMRTTVTSNGILLSGNGRVDAGLDDTPDVLAISLRDGASIAL